MKAEEAYVLSRSYTKKTVAGMGALKGSNCTIKSITHQNGMNIVVFEWIDNNNVSHESIMNVYDGTPIYVWESGNTYHYGDLVIYGANFYRCVYENSDVEFDSSHWEELNSPDGNYDIVPTISQLPVRFTAADKKMYYVYTEAQFYFWDGTAWVPQTDVKQFTTMPTASETWVNRTVQFIGTTDANYTHGFFYECVEDSGSYSWVNVATTDLSGKVDKETGKGLSTNDFTNTYKNQLDSLGTSSTKDYTDTFDEDGTEVTTGKAIADAINTEGVIDTPSQIMSFADGSDSPMKSCTVSIEPVQDLHGYDRPWAGGAGKNILENAYVSTPFATVNADGSVTLNGTIDSTMWITINSISLKAGTYTLSGTPQNAPANTYIYDDMSLGGWYDLDGNGITKTFSTDVTGVIRIRANAGTYDNLTFYPMIRLASDTDPTFAPYSNICPITGHDEVTVQNLTTIQSYYDIQSLVRSGDAQKVFKIGDEIPVKYTATNGTQYDMPFRVVDFKEVELEDGTTKTGMLLQSKYATLEGVQFDAPEPDNTLGSGGVKDDNVAAYGYNRWSESGIRAWLNSGATAGNWWGNTFERGSQTVNRRAADVAPTQLASINGFLRGLPSTFVDVLGKVKMQTSCNTVTDGGVTDVTYDKVFLASLEQMYITPQVSGVEGTYFDYWKRALGLSSPSSTYPSTYEAYITYAIENHNLQQIVRLRSAYRSNSHYAWYVHSSGYIGGTYAYTAYRSAPVCVIV